MAYDVTEPTDTTKIRNLGTVIRPNWVAIEDGESTFRPKAINLQNRTPIGEPNDPVTIADTSILYVKDDAAANPELYVKDGSGNILQFTQGASTIAAAAGEVFIPGGLRMKWGSFTAGGLTGTVTFSAAFPNNIFGVQITVNSTTGETASVNTLLAASFKWRTGGTTNVHYWIAYGN